VRSDEYWMKCALRQAEKAALSDETPIGAVIVYQNRIIGRGCNQRETRQDVTLHAEMTAIRQACRHLHSWRLDGASLYVTLEPCPMCAGAVIQSRINKLYYGAADPKAGACGSATNLFAIPFNHEVKVAGGLLAESSAALLVRFFQERRRKDKGEGPRSRRKQAAIRQSQTVHRGRRRPPFGDLVDG
jgi:tRNA(adenine34) deaminase